MPDPNSKLFVITGGPGAGKTTLIEALAASDQHTVAESGRRIIRQQNLISGPARPWCDPDLYAELLLSWDLRSHQEASSLDAAVFFDRGIPDTIGYLRLIGLPVPDHFTAAARRFAYNGRAFVCPPWREIYEQDEERKQTFRTAEETYLSIVEVYRELGYELLEVPPGRLADRRHFVLEAASQVLR